MTEDAGKVPDEASADNGEARPEGPPEKMGLSFYAAFGLVLLLVAMVFVLNYPAEKANAGIVMTETNWTLQSYTDDTGIHIPAISGSDVTARFGRDGRMGGRSGCNWYAFRYTTKDYAVNMTPESVTDLLCREPGVMEQESAFLSDLQKASSFRVSGSSLKFFDGAGKTVLVFVPG